jgi:hypothetical protein
MVGVAQLVRAPDCGSGGRGFETRHSPHFPLSIPLAKISNGFLKWGSGWRRARPAGKVPSLFRVANHMDGNQIRKMLLEVVDELSKQPNTVLQSGWILETAVKRLNLGNNIEHERALLSYFHDLFRFGHLAWGHNLTNSNPPFCHVTDQGRKTLAQISRDPANPDGYTQFLKSKVSLNPVAQSYISEALNTYNSGCFKACAVMVGVATESLIVELRDQLIGRLDSLGAAKPKELYDWRIKTVLDSLEKLLNQKKANMPHELLERFDSYWSALTHQVRNARNDAGYPKSIDPVSPEDVHASLLIFPTLALLAQDLGTWVTNSYS